MQTTCRKGMAGRERTYTPRVRTSRPIGAGRTENEAPSTPLAPPKARDDAWYIPAPLSQRLHDKSALGQTTSDGGILLTPEEVMFCHWYRHVPLPSLDWFEQEVANDATVATRTIAMDVLRNGGERVVPAQHLQKRFPSLHPMTWAIRWQRHERWQKHGGFSQIRLQRTHDELDWDELHLWVQTVHTAGHVAELCVIDDEFDATIYHLSTANPIGDQRLLSELVWMNMRHSKICWAQPFPWMGAGFFNPHPSGHSPLMESNIFPAGSFAMKNSATSRGLLLLKMGGCMGLLPTQD